MKMVPCRPIRTQSGISVSLRACIRLQEQQERTNSGNSSWRLRSMMMAIANFGPAGVFDGYWPGWA
jgi:hypothetical protein